MIGKGGGAIKRILALVLAAATLASTAATATAAEIDWSGVKKPAAEDVARSGQRYLKIGMVAGEPASSTGAFTMAADERYRYPDDFTVDDTVKLSDRGERFYILYAESGNARDYGYIATKREIAQWDVDVALKNADDATALVQQIEIAYEDVTLTNGDILRNAAYIDVELIPWLDTVGKKAFEIQLQLTAGGKKLSGTEMTISGSYQNGVQKAYREDDWIDLADPSERVVEAMDSIPAATVELEHDVFIDTRLFRGKKYYGRASDAPNELDIEIMDRYGFDEVINLYTVGLATDGNRVELAYRSGGYVYGVDNEGSYSDADSAQIVYLGQADAKLPYMTKYFLSSTRLELPYGLPAEPELLPERLAEEAKPDATPPAAKEPVQTANPNYNPPTGQ